ncbi:dystrotelin, partial [Kryptolebias marmoratus]|uniref:dystrotelin n=1 Tax=Kryptolebias marmoratus TaxID=37003 RepID=UPI0007F87CDE
YRCKKCVNVHVCQNCYLTNRQTRKHKTHHPVIEFCTQPTWRESLSSLVRNARHTLLPRRYTQRDVDRRVIKWVEPGESQNRAPPSSDASMLLADSTQSPPSNEDISHDASVCAVSPPCSSKSLQTDEELQGQQAAPAAELLTEVRNLQKDKWLLEQQLQAWRLTVQSEQGVLEDRCSEMEVTMDTLRQHNDRLQGMLVQALNKMETQQHANNTPLSFNTDHTDRETHTSTSDSVTNSEEEEEKEENILQTPSPTIQQDSGLSHSELCEEEPAKTCSHEPIGQQGWAEGAGLQKEDSFQSEEEDCGKCSEEEDCGKCSEEEDCGKCSEEERLQETVDKLKTEMENTLTKRCTGKRWEVELLQAAEQVGDSIRHLVESVRRN